MKNILCSKNHKFTALFSQKMENDPKKR